jgi:hypothetical protein
MKAFDFAFVSANGDSKKTHFLFLIKACYGFVAYFLLHYEFQAIALFNANEHEEAIQRVQELAVDFPDIDPLACRAVEVSDVHSIKSRCVLTLNVPHFVN